MIAPENRLIGWSALVLLPCGALMHWFPQACGAILLGFVAVLAVDAARAGRPLSTLEVRLPSLVRLTRSRPSEIAMEVCNTSEAAVNVRLGLGWPDGLQSVKQEIRLLVPPESSSWFSWPCLPTRRGKHLLPGCFVQVQSPLKLWTVRAEKPGVCEVRVYPDLAAARSKTASILLRSAAGPHLLRQIGQGREFEKLREYVPGDSYSEIHWKATAKRGRPITKAFQVEKTQEVYLVLDNSRLSGRQFASAPGQKRTPASTSALEYFIAAGLLLGVAAQRYGDLFGLVVYGHQIARFVRAGGGRQHFNACRQALYDLKTSPASPDLQELNSFIGGRLRRRALLVFLTDFDDPVTSESFLRNMELVARRHLVLVNALRDRAVARVFSRQSIESSEDVYAALAGHLQWQRVSELQRTLTRMGVQMELHPPELLGGRLISQYLNVKQRQLL